MDSTFALAFTDDDAISCLPHAYWRCCCTSSSGGGGGGGAVRVVGC